MVGGRICITHDSKAIIVGIAALCLRFLFTFREFSEQLWGECGYISAFRSILFIIQLIAKLLNKGLGDVIIKCMSVNAIQEFITFVKEKLALCTLKMVLTASGATIHQVDVFLLLCLLPCLLCIARVGHFGGKVSGVPSTPDSYNHQTQTIQ